MIGVAQNVKTTTMRIKNSVIDRLVMKRNQVEVIILIKEEIIIEEGTIIEEWTIIEEGTIIEEEIMVMFPI